VWIGFKAPINFCAHSSGQSDVEADKFFVPGADLDSHLDDGVARG
jgi:hypothetical protein